MLYGLSSTVLTFLTICLTAFAVVIFDSIAFPIIVLVAVGSRLLSNIPFDTTLSLTCEYILSRIVSYIFSSPIMLPSVPR
uniref:Uncharacterized protein n=1 Tax=Cowpox virus TaxID=10243 RepID=A0A0K2YS14_COWPX|nr:hypothetical protein pCPXV0028 [Cowpox virus]